MGIKKKEEIWRYLSQKNEATRSPMPQSVRRKCNLNIAMLVSQYWLFIPVAAIVIILASLRDETYRTSTQAMRNKNLKKKILSMWVERVGLKVKERNKERKMQKRKIKQIKPEIHAYWKERRVHTKDWTDEDGSWLALKLQGYWASINFYCNKIKNAISNIKLFELLAVKIHEGFSKSIFICLNK